MILENFVLESLKLSLLPPIRYLHPLCMPSARSCLIPGSHLGLALRRTTWSLLTSIRAGTNLSSQFNLPLSDAEGDPKPLRPQLNLKLNALPRQIQARPKHARVPIPLAQSGPAMNPQSLRQRVLLVSGPIPERNDESGKRSHKACMLSILLITIGS